MTLGQKNITRFESSRSKLYEYAMKNVRAVNLFSYFKNSGMLQILTANLTRALPWHSASRMISNPALKDGTREVTEATPDKDIAG